MVQSTQDIIVDSEGQWGKCHILEAGEPEWEPLRDPTWLGIVGKIDFFPPLL